MTSSPKTLVTFSRTIRAIVSPLGVAESLRALAIRRQG